MTKDSNFHEAIHLSLQAMTKILAAANQQIQEASGAIAGHEQNMAIGTLLGVETLLTQTLDLYKAVIAMHHFKP